MMRAPYLRPGLRLAANAAALAMLLLPPSARTQSAPASPAKSQVHIVIVGGGASHDFHRSYKETDATTLTSAGIAVQYTDSFQDLTALLGGANTVIQASNQTAPDAATRRALMEFVGKGGGLIAVHAGLWYNWADWTEYNRTLIGGGTRDHDKPGRFEVTVLAPNHPVMSGVPAHFEIEDELYHQQMEPEDAPVEVLATAYSPITGKSYPSVWTVKGQKGRIVCIALGHDERAHGNAAYQTILRNAVAWTASTTDSAKAR